jgi:hypothetical protein
MDSITRKPTSFRLRTDLLERLRRNARLANRTLNNYVESVLLEIVSNEPNALTQSVIAEAKSRREYPADELYSSADELFEALETQKPHKKK